MGRLLRLRKPRSPLHEVEETIAALNEELALTTNFAYAMVREENYRAAAQVIDEQRRSLAGACDRIERALRRPEIERSRMRTRAALVGLAAVLALGSGAFAAFGPGQAPARGPSRVEALQQASEALDAAVTISNPITLTRLVAPAQEEILAAAQSVATNPEVKATLLDSVEKLHQIINNPNLPETVRERAREVAETVEQIVVAVPEPVPAAEEEEPAPAESEPADASADADAATTEAPASATPTP